MEIRHLTEETRNWARSLLAERWGSTTIVAKGVLHHADRLPGLIAFINGRPKGLATYRISDDDCEIITLDALAKGIGIGTALVSAVRKRAKTEGCRRIRVITTNDNTPALKFYQRNGFEIAALYRNAVETSRKMKPEIPETGMDGIPIRDEIELVSTLP